MVSSAFVDEQDPADFTRRQTTLFFLGVEYFLGANPF
jgi:hypothetical protein